MYRIAISGHRGLSSPTAQLTDKAIRAALAEHAPDVTGISCLADGADQIFARAITDLAVWDGEPARSYGGTADVVAYARERGTPVLAAIPSCPVGASAVTLRDFPDHNGARP
jgi:methylmalonyl-CoA mutase cobalamin-binding subunit